MPAARPFYRVGPATGLGAMQVVRTLATRSTHNRRTKGSATTGRTKSLCETPKLNATSRPVALLVLLPTPARARIIATHLSRRCGSRGCNSRRLGFLVNLFLPFEDRLKILQPKPLIQREHHQLSLFVA